MCLLKRDQKDTNCGHDECKNFYAMNKQYCVYAMNKPQNPISLLANPSILLQTQNQPPRQFQQAVISPGVNASPSLNTKRPSSYQEPSAAEEEEIGMLNKKKIKAKGSIANSFYPLTLYSRRKTHYRGPPISAYCQRRPFELSKPFCFQSTA